MLNHELYAAQLWCGAALHDLSLSIASITYHCHNLSRIVRRYYRLHICSEANRNWALSQLIGTL